MLAAIMHKTLADLRQRIEAAIGTLDVDETQRRPARGGWSVQQIIEHLLLTYELTAQNFENRVAKGTASQARPTVKDRMGQFYVCTLGLFPKGRKSPAMVEPPAGSEPVGGAVLAGRARAALERFDNAAAAAERLFAERPAIVHPVLGPMNVGRWRRFHLVHGKHHMRQVEALRGA